MRKIVDFILRYTEKHIPSALLDENDVAMIRYGIEITLSSFLNIFIIMSLSIIFHRFFEGITFLIVFIVTRQFTGGFHANTYLMCNAVFSLCFLIVLCLYEFVNNCPTIIFFALFVFKLLVVIFMCPVENPNKPITSKKQYIRCKTFSIFIFLIGNAIGVFLVKNGYDIGKVVIITLQLIAFLCLITLIERRRSLWLLFTEL